MWTSDSGLRFWTQTKFGPNTTDVLQNLAAFAVLFQRVISHGKNDVTSTAIPYKVNYQNVTAKLLSFI